MKLGPWMNRFKKCTDPADEMFEPLYLVSTFSWIPLLNPVRLNSRKEEMLKLMKMQVAIRVLVQLALTPHPVIRSRGSTSKENIK